MSATAMTKSERAALIRQVILYVCEKRYVKVEDVLAQECGPRTVSNARAVICLLLASIASITEIRKILGNRQGYAVYHLMKRHRKKMDEDVPLAMEVVNYALALGIEFKVKGGAV